MSNGINSDLILGNNSELEITLGKDIDIELNSPEVVIKKKRVTKPRKVKEIEVSKFKATDPTYYYGSSPVLVKWKDWLLICNLVKTSQTFKDLYKEETFKYGDIEESGYVYPVYTKEPVEIKNLDGKVIETIPGIYNEELTMVLPPKFIFGIYRRFLFSQPSLSDYMQKIEQMPFEGFKYETKFPPRDEQIELGEIAKTALSQRRYLNGIVQCPPGWGKTFISIYIGSMVGAQVMIVVPNNLLKEQWVGAICEFTDLEEDDIGIIHGSDISKITKKGHMSKPVVICLIQSLDSQLKRNDPHVLSEFYRNVGMVIYDETHTSGAADGYAKTTGIFTTFNIVGLSATPYKKDKNLFQLYTGIGTIFYISTHQNLIPSCNMHLLPIIISEKDRRNLYDIFEKTNYNYFMSQLEDFLFKDDYYFQYIADWLEYRFKQGYSSVVLFKTNQMLEKLERYIRDKCEKTGLVIKSVILTNATAKTRKHEVATANIVLSNYKMFSAGADFPHLSCVFFASMVLGKIPIIQTLGRVTRKYADKIQDVQAHFLIPKFIYPLYSNNEPHLTISRAVKLQYPEAQFKWDKGFTDHFQEKKQAAENLVANDYKKFQQNTTGGVPLNGTRNNGSYMIDANYADNNRLGSYIQHQQYQEQGTGEFKRPPSLLPQG